MSRLAVPLELSSSCCLRRGYFVVGVELLHVREVRVTDADDHDAERELGALDDGVLGRRHVADAAVREDEQHRVAVGVLLEAAAREAHYLFQQRREQRRTRQRHVAQAVVVQLEYALDAVARRVPEVARAGEEVAQDAFVHVREVQLRAETVDRDLPQAKLPACRCRS